MSVNKAILDRIAGARASGGGNYIRDGQYTFTVLKLLLEQKYGGTCFIAELLVDSSNAVFTDVDPNPPGSTCSFVVNLDGAGKLSAPGNIKQFILALFGMDEAAVGAAEFSTALESMTSDKQPARGMVIGDETFRKFSRGGKNAEPDSKGRAPMTMHRWTTIKQTPDELRARVALLG